MEQITLQNVTKQYNKTVILNHLNQSFHVGESIAFMGHNGCGKSTLLKMIGGLVTPTSGQIHYHKPLLFHYVPEKFMPVALTARIYLKRMAEMDGIKKDEIGEKIEALSEDFFLLELLDIPMKYLSKGTLQKVGVIQALMKTPEVLLLDEPLSGQDKESQKVFIQKINQLKNQGVTVFMSCHEQSLVNAIADKTYQIEKGSLIAYQPENEREYLLILENTQNKPMIEGMERYGTGYKLLVKEHEAQGVIVELLQCGWELRGMYDEKNN